MSETKKEFPDFGKISPDIFNEIIYPQLGRSDADVVVGPRNGVDVGVVNIGNGLAMATTTDPFFISPTFGWEKAAWFAVHILASDAVTSGLPPKYITIDLNLPLSMTRDEFEIMWRVTHQECDKIGMAIVSGHTGRYDGCNYPMVGGATVICIGSEKEYVTPTMAQLGDHVIITKGAAVEAAGLFAVSFRTQVAERYGESFAKEAEDYFYQMSVVEDAFTAIEVGVRDDGITSMHDATECGIWGGLYEVAQASKIGISIDKDKIIVSDISRKICDQFGMDLYTSISEGTLIITCRPHKSQEVIQRLADKNIPASIVGELVEEEKGLHYFEGSKSVELVHPRVDPFWAAFGKAFAKYAS